jgi:hypothetical protein
VRRVVRPSAAAPAGWPELAARARCGVARPGPTPGLVTGPGLPPPGPGTCAVLPSVAVLRAVVMRVSCLPAGSSARPVCDARPGPVRWAVQTGGQHGLPGTGSPSIGPPGHRPTVTGPPGAGPPSTRPPGPWSAVTGPAGTGRPSRDRPGPGGPSRDRPALVGRPWSAATGPTDTGRVGPGPSALVRRHWPAGPGPPGPVCPLACPDRPAGLPGRAAWSRRENLGFACYV